MKYFILALFLSISFYSHSLLAGGINFCPNSRMVVLPGFGYSYFNSSSLVGVELSAVYTPAKSCYWFGGYVDHYTDFNQIQKSSVGLEMGFTAFGLDLGLIQYQNHQDSFHGFRIRPIFSLYFVSLYLGVAFSNEAYLDAGVLFKLPICLTPYGSYFRFECLD